MHQHRVRVKWEILVSQNNRFFTIISKMVRNFGVTSAPDYGDWGST